MVWPPAADAADPPNLSDLWDDRAGHDYRVEWPANDASAARLRDLSANLNLDWNDNGGSLSLPGVQALLLTGNNVVIRGEVATANVELYSFNVVKATHRTMHLLDRCGP